MPDLDWVLLGAAALLVVAAYFLQRARALKCELHGVDPKTRHKENFNRFSAYAALILGAAQLTAHIAGGIAIWITEFQMSIAGESFDAPQLPWNLVTAVGGFVVLSLVANYFSKQRDEAGLLGRSAIEAVLDALRRMLGREGGTVEAISVESVEKEIKQHKQELKEQDLHEPGDTP